MEDFTITYTQAYLYVALINAAVGFVLGLVPLLFGYFSGRLKIGLLGIIIATFGGALLGVFLSVPAMAISTWLIFRDRQKKAQTAASDTDPDKL